MLSVVNNRKKNNAVRDNEQKTHEDRLFAVETNFWQWAAGISRRYKFRDTDIWSYKNYCA